MWEICRLCIEEATPTKDKPTNQWLLFFRILADEWVKFDDDKVSMVTPEDILKLSGGGDWHIAYVLVYGPRRLEVMEEEQKQ